MNNFFFFYYINTFLLSLLLINNCYLKIIEHLNMYFIFILLGVKILVIIRARMFSIVFRTAKITPEYDINPTHEV